ncbi:MAG: formylglycine-generating enzyme family protein [Myxococcota bacterium]
MRTTLTLAPRFLRTSRLTCSLLFGVVPAALALATGCVAAQDSADATVDASAPMADTAEDTQDQASTPPPVDDALPKYAETEDLAPPAGWLVDKAGQYKTHGKPVCVADETACQNNQVWQCAPSGTAWKLMQTCGGSAACQKGACVPQVCAPGSKSCTEDGKRAVCRADGMGWQPLSSCSDGNACTDDTCSDGDCVHAPLADGSACGFGFECSVGSCRKSCPTGEVFEAGQCVAPDWAQIPARSAANGAGDIDGFQMQVVEVTNASFLACVQAGACSAPETSHPDCTWGDPAKSGNPVSCVTISQAEAYCDSVGGRLPTSDEWEWAARGGLVGAKFPWGDTAPGCSAGQSAAVFKSADVAAGGNGCGTGGTWAAGEIGVSNGYGLYDMAGNVWEFTSSASTLGAGYLICRGGSYDNMAGDLAIAVVGNLSVEATSPNAGFRCVR